MVTASNNFFTNIAVDTQTNPRHQLQMLTASDSVAAANMARYVIAAGLLVTGVRVDERDDCSANFISSFVLSLGERSVLMAATRRLDVAQVLLCFDVDDAAGSPCGMGVFRNEGDSVAVYPRCGLWAPANDGRAVIVPFGPSAPRCHFVSRPKRPLARIEGLPAGDLEAGLRRGQTRLETLARGVELSDAHLGAFTNVISTKGGRFEVDIRKLAA